MTESLFKIPKWESGDGYDATAAVNAAYKNLEQQQKNHKDFAELFSNFSKTVQDNKRSQLETEINRLQYNDFKTPTTIDALHDHIDAEAAKIGGLDAESMKSIYKTFADVESTRHQREASRLSNNTANFNFDKAVETKRIDDTAHGINAAALQMDSFASNPNSDEYVKAKESLTNQVAFLFDEDSTLASQVTQKLYELGQTKSAHAVKMIQDKLAVAKAEFSIFEPQILAYGDAADDIIKRTAAAMELTDEKEKNAALAALETEKEALNAQFPELVAWMESPNGRGNFYTARLATQDNRAEAAQKILDKKHAQQLAEANLRVAQQNAKANEDRARNEAVKNQNDYILGSKRLDIEAASLLIGQSNKEQEKNDNHAYRQTTSSAKAAGASEDIAKAITNPDGSINTTRANTQLVSMATKLHGIHKNGVEFNDYNEFMSNTPIGKLTVGMILSEGNADSVRNLIYNGGQVVKTADGQERFNKLQNYINQSDLTSTEAAYLTMAYAYDIVDVETTFTPENGKKVRKAITDFRKSYTDGILRQQRMEYNTTLRWIANEAGMTPSQYLIHHGSTFYGKDSVNMYLDEDIKNQLNEYATKNLSGPWVRDPKPKTVGKTPKFKPTRSSAPLKDADKVGLNWGFLL